MTIHDCLKKINIKNSIVIGYVEFEDSDLKIPHVWNVVKGKIIDNTYREDISPDMQKILNEKMIYMNDINEIKESMFVGDEYTMRMEIEKFDMDVFSDIKNNPDKFKADVIMKKKNLKKRVNNIIYLINIKMAIK